jgi:ABC-type transporter Mla subunit MlaD
MANNDMIQAKQVVDDLTASFEKHASQIKTAWENLEKYSKGIVELPSEVKSMMTAINNDTNAVLKQNEALNKNIQTYNQLKTQKQQLNKLTSESTARMNETSKASSGWFANMSGGLKNIYLGFIQQL